MFGRARLPGPGGLHLPIGRRGLLRATAILSSAGLLGAGGVPVFAHPMASMRGRVIGMDLFREMIDAGLAGVEVFHRDNPDEARRTLRLLALEHDLFITGSSDYHGTGKPNRIGENTTPDEVVARLEEQATGTEVIRP